MRKEAASAEGFRRVPLTAQAIIDEGDLLFARCHGQVPPRPPAPDLPPPARLSLLHTDMGATNLIGRGSGLRLIDWQCPAAGDLAEDIYTVLSPAFHILNHRSPLTAAERAAFHASLGQPRLSDRARALRPAYAYRMGAYCLWRSETHPDAEVRRRYVRALAAELPEMRPA